MNDEYYYIKIRSIEYDGPDYFLTDEGIMSLNPRGIRVFNDIDDAIETKNHLKNSYSNFYYIDIVRF